MLRGDDYADELHLSHARLLAHFRGHKNVSHSLEAMEDSDHGKLTSSTPPAPQIACLYDVYATRLNQTSWPWLTLQLHLGTSLTPMISMKCKFVCLSIEMKYKLTHFPFLFPQIPICALQLRTFRCQWELTSHCCHRKSSWKQTCMRLFGPGNP
jgi:hypothetical protein